MQAVYRGADVIAGSLWEMDKIVAVLGVATTSFMCSNQFVHTVSLLSHTSDVLAGIIQNAPFGITTRCTSMCSSIC